MIHKCQGFYKCMKYYINGGELEEQDSGYLSPTNKIGLLPIENMVELIAEDARTINNNSETARRMGLTPSGLTRPTSNSNGLQRFWVFSK